jgi:hypothetical protein
MQRGPFPAPKFGCSNETNGWQSLPLSLPARFQKHEKCTRRHIQQGRFRERERERFERGGNAATCARAHLEEGLSVGVSAAEEPVKAHEGDFAHGACDAAAAPDQVVLQTLGYEGDYVGRPERRRLGPASTRSEKQYQGARRKTERERKGG